MSGARRFRELLARPGAIVAPGAYDGLIARVFQSEGFEALFISGNAISTSLGLVDLGLATMTEVVNHTRAICDGVEIPVLIDADTGYGNAMNVRRTVKELERAGVAGLMLEDQTTPKRCGHLAGKEVIPLPEAVGKLRAALDARTNPDTAIIARTDGYTVEGLGSAIERGQAYAEAGADLVFVESLVSEDEARRVAQAIPAPLMSSEVLAGRKLSRQDVEQLGFKLLVIAGAVTAVVFGAVRDLARYLRAHDSLEGYQGPLVPRREIDEVIDLQRLMELSASYAPGPVGAAADRGRA
jgi:2-methylisocitrate lyase-like PEP mutase family enzyme